ncbi:MAG: PEP-CTERM sorting domain-containing protein [Thermoguttaceae bacterium]
MKSLFQCCGSKKVFWNVLTKELSMFKVVAKFCYLLIFLLGMSHIAYSAPQYRLITIGNLPGADGSGVADINDNGQVVGSSFSSDGNYSHAFIYDPTTGLNDLGVVPGDASSYAYGVNNRGDVVGESFLPGGGSRAFIYSSTSGMTSLGGLPGWSNSTAYSINDLGTVVGKSYSQNQNLSRGFIYKPGAGIYDPGILPGEVTEAQDVNNSDTIVWHKITPNVTVGTYLYDSNGYLQAIGGLQPGGGYNGQSLSNIGHMAGTTIVTDSSSGKKSDHAILTGLPGSPAVDVGFLPGTSYAWAYGVNDLDQVVGDTGILTNSAFLYSEGSLCNINQLLDLSDPNTASWVGAGGHICTAKAINDSGWIAAQGVMPPYPIGGGAYAYPPQQAFLLVPVPEPITLVLLVFGGIAFLALGWRRSV